MQDESQAETGKNRGLRNDEFGPESSPTAPAVALRSADFLSRSRFEDLSPATLSKTASSSPGTEYWLP
jgi:hypothetical protein